MLPPSGARRGPASAFQRTRADAWRLHHGSNPRYLDANYAPVFIFWDRLFGTFIEETDVDPVRYGLVHNIASHNPLRVAFFEWAAILEQVRAEWLARQKPPTPAPAPGAAA